MKLSTLENKENCIDDFLKCDDFIKKHAEIIQQYDQLFYIYKITNKKTNKIYKERLHVNYDEFFHLAKLLVDILIQNSNDENYSIKFIHQSDDSETGYVFNDPEIILKYYNSLVKDCKVKEISYSHHDN